MARGPGRPTEFTPANRKKILAGLRAGLTRKCVSARAGISYQTLQHWLYRSRSRKKADAEYRTFFADVKKAEQDAAARNVATIQRAAAQRDEVTVKETVRPDGSVERVTTTKRVFDWCAAAWLLERKYPEEWSSGRGELAELRKQVAALLKVAGDKIGEPRPLATESPNQNRSPDNQAGGEADPRAV